MKRERMVVRVMKMGAQLIINERLEDEAHIVPLLALYVTAVTS